MNAGNDTKIRELVERMVAMSPEPPPFPEDIAVARPRPVRARRSPALVFAMTVAAVLLAGLPLLIWSGDGEDPVGPGRAGIVYLAQDPVNSFVGNPALVPFRVLVPGEADSSETELGLRGLADADLTLPPGHYTMVPAELEIVGVTETTGLVTVDLNDAFLRGAGGLLADLTVLNQLIYTATHANPEAEVVFTVNGGPIEAYGTEGLSLTEPLGRDAFLDSLNLINLTEPLGAGGEGPEVKGVANVFEATVSLQVTDSTGTVVHKAFTNATCGTGCWGVFEFELDPSLLIAENTVLVFWNSAEDGQPANVVSIPIADSADGVWGTTP